MNKSSPGSTRRRLLAGIAASGGLLAVRGSSAVPVAGQRIVTPEMFGDIADGAGDAAPAIAAALAFAAEQGAQVIRFTPGKTYRLASWARGSDVSSGSYRASIALPPRLRNLTFDLNGATLLQACDAMTFGALYRMFNDETMRASAIRLRALPAPGAKQAALARPSGLRPGSIVMLVSSRTYAPVYTPIAELLEVAEASGDSVRFASAVRKAHIAPKSDPLGLIDITDHHIRDCRLIGPGRIVNRYRRAGSVFQAFGFAMSRIDVVGRGGFIVRGRGLTIGDCSAQIQADWSAPVFRPYAIGFDTGTSEASIAGFHADGGSNMTYLHLHEGLADIAVSDLTIINGTRPDPAGAHQAAISILGQSDNVSLSRIRIANNPQGPAIEARLAPAVSRGNHGLQLRDIVVSGTFAGAAVVVNDSDPAVLDNVDLSNARLSRGTRLLQISGGSHRLAAVRLPQNSGVR
jgi:hypothetical protein